MSLPLHINEPILTERLVLRPFEAADLDAVHDMQSRPEVVRYLYWQPRDRREAKASLKRKMGLTRIDKAGDVLNLAVTERSGGVVIGDVMLTYTSALHQQAELGYLFSPAVHGQGYATEATAIMVDLAFDVVDVHRVFAHLDPRNTPSARLLERLGLRLEGHLVQNEMVKGEWTDDLIYGVLADEWATLRAGRSAGRSAGGPTPGSTGGSTGRPSARRPN
jgi:RimJ/RimL family protein N-acetyltransferase